MSIEIRVSTQDEEDFVVGLVRDGKLGELLGAHPYVVRTTKNGHVQTIAGGGTSNTVHYGGSGAITSGGGGGGGGGGNVNIAKEHP